MIEYLLAKYFPKIIFFFFFRKIVDNVEWLTSAEQIAEYVKNFRWGVILDNHCVIN